ncbi:GNAT family N-acetyltransferase [Paenibacillus doosanensis]|uniref:GNAT family N-acetyltransferase n=1 Tax=Paenibacillus doosanensis TaxID=1229154 RepID=UPI002180087C|nr:GNAT family N-acetyltransferase [Paenibacillus doosanensis]MCS7459071.1 GNAT family N-acetyltransferase [Paenibacillus doosanensis]
MDYHRITNIADPYFKQMHELMQTVFPPEEVLEYELWAEPLQDPGIRVFVAVHEGQVVGATEYRYYEDMQVAMTDFTIIGREGLGIGPFLVKQRTSDLLSLVGAAGGKLLGMFAEIYNPYLAQDHSFGGVKPMDPFVRREVLAHIGYRKLDLGYVHPSWHNDGAAVQELDLGFMPFGDDADSLGAIPASLISAFLERYYAVLPNKPQAWYDMVAQLKQRDQVRLLPL